MMFGFGMLCGAVCMFCALLVGRSLWETAMLPSPWDTPVPPPVAPLPNFVTATEVRERLRELDAMTFPAQSSMPGSISYLVRSV